VVRPGARSCRAAPRRCPAPRAASGACAQGKSPRTAGVRGSARFALCGTRAGGGDRSPSRSVGGVEPRCRRRTGPTTWFRVVPVVRPRPRLRRSRAPAAPGACAQRKSRRTVRRRGSQRFALCGGRRRACAAHARAARAARPARPAPRPRGATAR